MIVSKIEKMRAIHNVPMIYHPQLKGVVIVSKIEKMRAIHNYMIA